MSTPDSPLRRCWAEHADQVLLTLALLLLAAGGIAWLADDRSTAQALWTAATILGLGLSATSTARALRQHRPTVDVIAVLALAGALLVDEAFAGAVITVMLTTGQALEARAAARARRELSLLVQRAPRTARRRVSTGVVEIPADEVRIGDRLLVGSGEVVPVDGRLPLDPPSPRPCLQHPQGASREPGRPSLWR